MFDALILPAALLLDRWLGEPARWHPLVGFGRWANWLEQRLYRPGIVAGGLATLAATAPFVALVVWLDTPLLALPVLWFTLGYQSLVEHGERVHEALESGDLALARQRVGMIVSRDTSGMSEQDISLATVESLLENGNDAIFGALFWFAWLGAPGALLYRLINTLDAMWGYRTPRYLAFGRVAARLDDLLNYLPARLTALSYAATGSTAMALGSWKNYAPAWESPNAGPVMAAGAGALGLRLGGPALYHGEEKHRPPLGDGKAPQGDDIARAITLVKRSTLLWLAVMLLIQGALHLA